MRRRLLAFSIVVLGMLVALATMPASSAAFVDTGSVETSFASTEPARLDFAGAEAGDDYSLGWTSDGRLFTWGANGRGQLGLGDYEPRDTPTPVVFPAGVSIADASAGINMSIAVTTAGDVYTWGNADVAPSDSTPGLVTALSGEGVIGVSAGGYFFLAWTADGRLFSWGNNGGGRLGRAGVALTPGLVTAQGVNARFVERASAGRFIGTAVVGDGSAVGWGTAYAAQTGGTFSGLPAGVHVAGIYAGNSFVFAWTDDGQLYSGATTFVLAQETALADRFVRGAGVSVPASGTSSFFAWDDGGQLFAWGLNAQGQLGLGDYADRASPTPVVLPPGAAVAELAAGNAHTLLAGTDGSFSAVGSNTAGQLGTNDTVGRNTFSSPVLIVRWP